MHSSVEEGFSQVEAQEVFVSTLGLDVSRSCVICFSATDSFCFFLAYLFILELFVVRARFIPTVSKPLTSKPRSTSNIELSSKAAHLCIYILSFVLICKAHSDLSTSAIAGYTYQQNTTPVAAYVTKKYKPVAKKIRPVATELPERFRIVRHIKGDPLKNLPALPTRPADFEPEGQYTFDRMKIIERAHPEGFLWPEERKLMHQFMRIHQNGFTWSDNERGHFREEFFPPIEMPTIPHKPWVVKNLPIPPGIYEQICKEIKRKIDAGVFEPSNSSYRS